MTGEYWADLVAQNDTLTPEARQALCGVLEASHVRAVSGLSRPPKALVRRVAARLIAEPRPAGDPLRDRELAVALLSRWDSSQDGVLAEDGRTEHRKRYDLAVKALDIAWRANDEDLVLFATWQASIAAFGAHEWPADRAMIERVWATLPDVSRESESQGQPFWSSLTGNPGELARGMWRLRARFAVATRASSLMVTAGMPDLEERFLREVDLVTLAIGTPEFLARRLHFHGLQARRRADRDGFRAAERGLVALFAETHDVDYALHLLMNARTQNATKLQDNTESYRWATVHCALLAGVEGVTPDTETPIPPGAVADRLPAVLAAGLTEPLRRIGNAAFNASSALYHGGRARVSEQALLDAEAWLDIAEQAWSDFGSNGPRGIQLSRIRLKWLGFGAPRITSSDARAGLLEVVTHALQGGTRRNAAAFLAEVCHPVDPEVERVLEREISLSIPAHRGAQNLAMAELFARRAEATREPQVWRDAERYALAAVDDLWSLKHLGDPQKAASAAMLAAVAAERIDPSGSRSTLLTRLDRLLLGIEALGLAVLHISTEVERQWVRERHAALYVAAAEAALALDDPAAADLIMETLRRERVGMLLFDLSHDPSVSETVRAHAERVRAASVSAPPSGNLGDEPAGVSEDEAGTRAVHTLVEVQRAAGAAAQAVLGPLTALSVSTAITHQTTAAIFEALGDRTRTLVLLQLAVVDADRTDDTALVLRRLSIRHPGMEVQESLDSVEVDQYLLDARPTSPGYFLHLPELARTLLPAALIETLIDHESGAGALRLLVVPTGFHTVPFEALPLTSELQVIDRASVTTHTSLTTIRALLSIQNQPAHSKSTAVFDPKLTYAQAERRALVHNVSLDHDVRDLEGLHSALHSVAGIPGGVLVMAVHGASSADGWAQTKKLPDESLLRPADLMGWEVPRLCVLASCHSSIASADGLELSGFPLAMFLSGATTVVGSLLAVPDKSTSEIMVRFWELVGRGTNPVDALREAKLEWMTSVSKRRRMMRDWAGLVIYGGAHY